MKGFKGCGGVGATAGESYGKSNGELSYSYCQYQAYKGTQVFWENYRYSDTRLHVQFWVAEMLQQSLEGLQPAQLCSYQYSFEPDKSYVVVLQSTCTRNGHTVGSLLG